MVAHLLTSLEVLYKHHKHVAVKIESTWGTQACDELLHNYLVKNRNNRQGFCPSVYKELVNLYLLHSKKYGSKYTKIDLSMDLNVNT
jgi:hypothetical protein